MNKITKFKNERAILATAKILGLSILIMILFFFLFDYVFNNKLARVLYDFDVVLWYKIMDYKWQIVLLLYVLVVIVSSFIVIKKDNSYMDKLFSAIESIIENPNEKIALSKELELLEMELNKIRMNLVQSNQKAQDEKSKKDDLILYMAHDLKTPLTSVIGYLNILKEEKNVSKEVREKYVGIALDKALRVEELTNQFFEITRYDLHEMKLKKNNIDLILLLNQLIEESMPIYMEKNLQIELNAKQKLIFNGDGDLLARAFGNLIKNAIKYSYRDSLIVINVKEMKEDVELVFKNEGDLIPSYKLDKLFDKFYRADDARNSSSGGVGLGLSITKEIIELHDGSIEVFNRGKYIIFKVKLKKD